MKYLMMGFAPKGEWGTLAAEEQTRRVRQHQAAVAKLIAERGASSRKLLFAGVGLQNSPSPTTVRNVGGKFSKVDGPFAETKEVLGGFDIIDFDSREEALKYVEGMHSHDGHTSEVRPINDLWWIQHSTGKLAKTFLIAMFDNEEISAKRPVAEVNAIIRQHEVVANDYLAERGTVGETPVFWVGARLDWSRNAATLRIRDGKRRFSDGPFAETREVVGGLTLVTCDSIDEALGYARKLSARQGDMASVMEVGTFWWIYHG